MGKRDLFALFAVVVSLAGAALAQEPGPSQSDAPALREVRATVEQAQKEITAFREGGGKNDDPTHPAVKWLAVLWDYRQKYPDSEASAIATFEALHFLFHAGRGEEVLTRMDSLAFDDTAWDRLPSVLNELANEKKDTSLLTSRLERVLSQSTKAKNRAAAALGMGRALRQTDATRARALLERAVKESPDSPAAREANNLIYEVANLSVGKPAPAFAAKAWKGEKVALEGYKNQALVLVFWAST